MTAQKITNIYPLKNLPKSDPTSCINIIDTFLDSCKLSSPFSLDPVIPLLPKINSETTNHILSKPEIPLSACLAFFKLILENRASNPQAATINSYLILASRLFRAKRYVDMNSILNSIATLDAIELSVSDMVSLAVRDFVPEKGVPKFTNKLCRTLFKLYSNRDITDRSVEVLKYMVDQGFKVDEKIYGVYIMRKKHDVDNCVYFLSSLMGCGVKISHYVFCTVINELCNRGRMKEARNLIEEANKKGTEPNIVAYNAILSSYIKKKNTKEANEILRVIHSKKLPYNASTYTILINKLTKSDEGDEAEKLFREMETTVGADVRVYNTMIAWNCKNGRTKKAFQMYNELNDKGLVPSIHTYGALIHGVCRAGDLKTAEILIAEMGLKGHSPNRIIYNTMIDGYCRSGKMGEAMKVQRRMHFKGFESDAYTYNSLANGYSKANKLDEAERCLNSMVEQGIAPNVVNYTTLIEVRCKRGKMGEARKLLGEMESRGISPNAVTFNVLIHGYVKIGKLREAYEVRGEMVGRGVPADTWTHASLVYGECVYGRHEEAMRQFALLKRSDGNGALYSKMILGLCFVGKSDEAFRLYDEMRKSGIFPFDKVYGCLVGSLHKC